jgi:hypothetical protein
VKAVIMVATQQRHIITFFRDLDHSNGDSYFLRSGCGGSDPSICELLVLLDRKGSGLSKVK